MIMTSREIPGLTPAGPGGIALRPCFHFNIPITQGDVPRLYRRRVVTNFLTPAELYDAHACGKEDVAFQATRTRRSGSPCEP